jgi:hypothetical protein
MGIVAATSTPASTTAGGASAMAAKLLTIAVAGGAAAGVTAREVANAPTVGHVKPPPVVPVRVPAQHDSTKPSASTAVTTAWASHGQVSGRLALTPASDRPTHRLPRVSSAAVEPVVASPDTAHVVPGAPVESTPPEAPVTAEAQGPQTAPPTEEPAPSSSTPVADATPASSGADGAAADASATPSSPDVTVAAEPRATAPETAPTTPVTTPPTTPPPTAHGNGSGNANGNTVGQGGTPPGQLNKPDPPVHGHS